MFFRKGVELGAAKSAQYRIAHGYDRRRTRQSIEDRKLTYNPAPADEGKYARYRSRRPLSPADHPRRDSSCPRIVGEEQDLICGELHRLGAGKQISRGASAVATAVGRFPAQGPYSPPLRDAHPSMLVAQTTFNNELWISMLPL
jgi:hypothetical protein